MRHGSRDANAIREFGSGEMLDARLPDVDVDHGFKFATPVIRTGLDALREGKYGSLRAARHVVRCRHVKTTFPPFSIPIWRRSGVNVHYGRELGIDMKMVRCRQRIEEALETAETDVPKHETLLMVVGAARQLDANSNISKVMRLVLKHSAGWEKSAIRVSHSPWSNRASSMRRNSASNGSSSSPISFSPACS